MLHCRYYLCVAMCCSVLQCVYAALPVLCCGIKINVCSAACGAVCCSKCCSVLYFRFDVCETCGVCVYVVQHLLQCVAVRCSVLQCVAVCCSVLQCVAVCRSALQCVAVCCTFGTICERHVTYACVWCSVCCSMLQQVCDACDV